MIINDNDNDNIIFIHVPTISHYHDIISSDVMMMIMMIMGITMIVKNGHDDNRHDNNDLSHGFTWPRCWTPTRVQVSGTHHVTLPTPVEARMC